MKYAPKYHPNRMVDEWCAAYACAGFHPWPCVPRGCERPISEWTIAEFIAFMAGECGVRAASGIRITTH